MFLFQSEVKMNSARSGSERERRKYGYNKNIDMERKAICDVSQKRQQRERGPARIRMSIRFSRHSKRTLGTEGGRGRETFLEDDANDSCDES